MRGSAVPELTTSERLAFWSQTARSSSGCLEWTGQHNGKKPSYGLFTFYRDGRKHRLMAHRVALALSVGGDGEFACHHCDNPPCVEPTHLYWGDPQSNADDARRRDRRRNSSGPRRGGYARPDYARLLSAHRRKSIPDENVVTSDEIGSWYESLIAGSRDFIERFVARVERGDDIQVETDWLVPVFSFVAGDLDRREWDIA